MLGIATTVMGGGVMPVYVVCAYMKYGSNALCVFSSLEEAENWCKDNTDHRYSHCFHIIKFQLDVGEECNLILNRMWCDGNCTYLSSFA